jgi:hypothetical protein
MAGGERGDPTIIIRITKEVSSLKKTTVDDVYCLTMLKTQAPLLCMP